MENKINYLENKIKLNSLITEEKQTNSDFKMMISELFHSRIQAHIFHLQVKSSSSYAEHKALQDYYESIDDIIDSIIESYQGKYDIVKGYKSFPIVDYENSQQLITYFKDLVQKVSDKRKSIKESYLQNQIDNIEQLIYSTLYKLRNLK